MVGKRKSTSGVVTAEEGVNRRYISQADVPAHSLDDAMRVPLALSDHFGKAPTKPLRVAQSMNITPGSSRFRMLCGASIAYGLTEGGYNSDQIALSVLGRRVVAPSREGDDFAARREATLRPRIVREILTRYNGSKLPPVHIARNVLEEMGVPADRTAAVYTLILESAKAVGFLREVKGQQYVDLESAAAPQTDPAGDEQEELQPSETKAPTQTTIRALPSAPGPAPALTPLKRTNRVFITHGKNQDIVGQLKELLTFGGFTPVVAIESESVSKPVPEKVLDEMRTCDAAVIHVGREQVLIDKDGKEHRQLNENVLIEIGAAMALYAGKFILLVETGTTLPTNLRGLYEVRYEGGKLDYAATMRLLKAFSDFRS